MNDRDDLLRAACYRAYAAKGTDAFAGRCYDVVDGYMLFPAIEAELALARLRKQRVDRAQWIADSVALMRATYPQARRRAA